jgi:polyisoprenoid-binding protein YceI
MGYRESQYARLAKFTNCSLIGTYTDTTHSENQFKVKQLMISTVTGQFNKFDGGFESEGNDFLIAKAVIRVDVNSISTNYKQHDAHVRTDDFSDAKTFLN